MVVATPKKKVKKVVRKSSPAPVSSEENKAKFREAMKAMQPKPKPAQKKVAGSAPHLIVVARAGTGKTTTSVGGIALMCQDEPKVKKPSAQQLAIWEAMQAEPAIQIRVCAFSKAIQTELEKRIPYDCVEVRTCHSFGNSFLRQHNETKWSKMNNFKNANLLEEITGTPFREMKKKGIPYNQVDDVVRLAKMELVDAEDEDVFDRFEEIITAHGIECNGSLKRVLDLSQQLLLKSKEYVRHEKYNTWHMPEFDFADMIWLPIALDVHIPKVDLIVVDEAQDLNRCQQELCIRMGDRLVLVGDDKQAIFGFAGADCRSMSRMEERLRETERGVQTLPLNITYRCGKKIVERAQTIVPDYQAYEGNPDGEILEDVPDTKLVGLLNPVSEVEGHVQDMVVCRVNAPLVSLCFKLLTAKKKARIQGRDIGQGLLKLIDKMKANTIPELEGGLMEWHGKELNKLMAKKFPSDAAIIALNDKLTCLMKFAEHSDSVAEVRQTIEAIFTDSGTGVLLSSIHRAKGLEAKRVFILCPEKMPHPMAKTKEAKEQEEHLRYVAYTRAIETLVFVKTTETEKEYQ